MNCGLFLLILWEILEALTDSIENKCGWMQRRKKKRVLVSISDVLIIYNYLYLFIYVGNI
jgi:hypothetical protein